MTTIPGMFARKPGATSRNPLVLLTMALAVFAAGCDTGGRESTPVAERSCNKDCHVSPHASPTASKSPTGANDSGPMLAREASHDDRTHFYAGAPVSTTASANFDPLDNLAFSVGYSESRRNPLWSAYRIEALEGTPASLPRPGFKMDPRTTARVSPDDYKYTGYDRGHMTPNYAIASRFGRDAQKETFFMSNICPQCPGLNQEPWEGLEKVVASDFADEFEEVWVTCGPIFSANEQPALESGVQIPVAFYMIVVDEDGGNPSVLAIIMKQTDQGTHKLRDFVTSVDQIESRTGLDFLSQLPDPIEDRVESTTADERWNLDQTLAPSHGTRNRAPCGPGTDD